MWEGEARQPLSADGRSFWQARLWFTIAETTDVTAQANAEIRPIGYPNPHPPATMAEDPAPDARN